MLNTNPFSNIINAEVLEKLKEYQNQIDKLSENISQSLKELSVYGWYITGNTEIQKILKLVEEIKKGNIEKIDKAMKTLYDSNFNSIIIKLNKSYPERKVIFTEASKAHKLKMYHASTCLFLSQADGICKGNLFILRNNKKNLQTQIKKFDNEILEEFLGVVMNISAIDAPHSSRSKYPSKLNRHGVFHGLDFDYGTNINSLKSLSLLAFIGDFFNRYKKNID